MTDTERLLLSLVEDYRFTALNMADERIASHDALLDEYERQIQDLEDEIKSLSSQSLTLQSELEREKSATANERIKFQGLLKLVEDMLISNGDDFETRSLAKENLADEEFALWNVWDNERKQLKVGN